MLGEAPTKGAQAASRAGLDLSDELGLARLTSP